MWLVLLALSPQPVRAEPDAWALAAAELDSLDATDRLDWVDARLSAGERGLAEAACRQRVEANPDDSDAWVLLARVFADDHDRAEVLLDKALAIDPDHAPARVDLGRILWSRGQPHQAAKLVETVLDGEGASSAGWQVLAQSRWSLGDAAGAREAARRAVDLAPDEVDGWLLLARLGTSSALAEGLEHHPEDPELWAAAADLALHRGDLVAADEALAHAASAAPRSSEVSRLRPLLDCQRRGALDAAGHASIDRHRRTGMLGLPERPPDTADALVERYPRCGVVWAARAAARARRDDLDGALTDLGQALARMPADASTSAAYGLALLESGQDEDARRWLRLAGEQRPWDHTVALARANAALASGDVAHARAVLTQSWTSGSGSPELAVALASVLEDREASFELLLAAVERSPRDEALVQAAVEVGTSLGREGDVYERVRTLESLQAVQDARPPLPTDPTDEDIVVVAEKESVRLRGVLDQRLQELGFAPGRDRGDRTVYRATTKLPAITVHHDDGLLDIQGHGFLAMDDPVTVSAGASGTSGMGSTVGVGTTVTIPRFLTPKQMGPKRWELLEQIRPQVDAWRDAIATEGTQEALESWLPEQVDALWNEGVPLSGRGRVDGPDARRAALLEHWSSRTCTPQGQLVRDWLQTYLRQEVQGSAFPATPEEIQRASAACPCDDLDL